MNRKVISCLSSSLFFCLLALPVRAESILAKIQQTGTLNLAIREDAAPFGYLDSSGNLQGYCLDFFELLEKQLITTLNRNTLSIKLLKSTASTRFSLVSNGIVYLECGANSIRPDPPDRISFSTAFFITGTQLLINQKNRSRLNLDRSLNEVILGVVDNTTTERYLAKTYPAATIQKFSGVTARSRGVEGVTRGKIDAMVDDGILLRAEAQKQGLISSDYHLIPQTPLTCDRYGMIIKSEDPQWQDFVNSIIDSPEAGILYRAWFGSYLADRNLSKSEDLLDCFE